MMKSLRKDTGGYALLYVMVIVFVLCAISMMICTVALRNLQSQEASVKRMEEKYAAQGEIEKIKAKIEAMDPVIGEEKVAEAAAITSAETAYVTVIQGYDTSEELTIKVDTTAEPAAVTIEVQKDTTKIAAVLQLNRIKSTPVTSVTVDGVTTQTYTTTITTNSVTFTSYTIESTGGAA